ncbi:IS30 family transposase [Leuconostocaceae bacterium ESL0958]|nr:IS30 family transposase [Leuconostocaceae bacterium ESL0958]
MGYRRLQLADRVKIETLIKERYNLSQIASRIGFSRAAVYKEIQRATKHKTMNHHLSSRVTRTMYDALSAEARAKERRHLRKKTKFLKITPALQEIIKTSILKDKWSPEQIVNHYKKVKVTTTTVYNWINLGRIPGLSNKNLRCRGKRYKRALSKKLYQSLHQSKSDKQACIQKHSIDDRPVRVGQRVNFGHWELDGMESMQSKAILLTFVERYTRYADTVQVKSKSAADVAAGIESLLIKYGKSVKSVTCDRGSEFLSMQARIIFQKYRVKHYYAHAYAPHERGTNENYNRLLREYYPKKTDFARLRPEELAQTVLSINTRPMRLHGFKSRHTAFRRIAKLRKLAIAGVT